ncbi:unnamed protein product [Effrenium voratum]|uniref:Uncharacterized protein n=1 Tax=Effrenium voratum TaxID=2562239 RepID=A0AA36JS70_9DINO|nr:unnamed protein product [Effrenium voratum]
MAQACLRAEWEATQGEVCGLASHGERNRAETAATQASRVSNRKVDRKSLCLDSQRTTSWISKEVQPLAMISADATAHAAPNGIMTRKRQRALRAASDLAPGSCTDLETETEGSNNPVASQAADGCQDSQVQSLIPKHRPRGPPRGASMTAAAATDPVQPTLVVDAAAHAELPPSGGNVRAADARKRQRVLRAASDLAPGSRTDLETETEGSDNPGASQTADRQIDSQVQSLSHPNVTRATSMTTAAGPAQLADGRLDSLSAAVLSGQAEGTSTLVVDAAAPAAPSGNAGNMHATDARKRQRVLRAASDLAPGSDTEVETETEGSNNPVASQAADCCQDSQVQSLSAPHMARASSVTAAAATDPVQPTLVVDAAAHAAVPPPGNVRATDSRKRQRALRAASDLAPGSCTDVEMGVEGSNSLVASQAADCRQDSQRQSLSAPNMARAASMTAAAADTPAHFGGGCHSTCCSKSGCIRSSRQPGTKFDCSAHGEGGIHDRSRSNRSSPTCRQQIGFASECCVEWASRGHANFGGCRCTCLNYCGPIRSACSQCERKCYGKHSSDPVFGRAASAFSMRE